MANQTYYATVLASTPAANRVHLALWNGTTASVLRIGLIQAAGAPTSAVTGLVVPLYVQRITTIPTSGTDITITKARTSNANVPASIVCKTNSTGGSELAGSPVGIGTVNADETASLAESVLYRYLLNGEQPLTLDPSQGIVVRQNGLASSGAINVMLSITVTPST
jgi:hypothetical protein